MMIALFAIRVLASLALIGAFIKALVIDPVRDYLAYADNQLKWADIILDYRAQELALYRELNELTDTYIGGTNNDNGWTIYQKAESIAALRKRALAAKRLNHSADEWIAAKGGAA
ncbi:hypothetical protein D3C72_1759080 [compost metagenome]